MRKIVLCLVLAVLGFSSCKKDKKPTSPPTDTKTYSVKFKVADFNAPKTNSTGNIRVNDITVPASVSRIIYAVVNTETNIVVSRILQEKGAANFGSFDDKLAPGTYTVNFAAGSSLIEVNDLNYTNSGPASPLILSLNSVDDAFATSFPLTVSNQPIDQTVNLHRIVGQVSVKLLDVLPANAYNLKIDVTNDGASYLFSTDKISGGGTASRTIRIPATAIGTTGYTQSRIVGNTGADVNHTVTITCLDATGNIIAQKAVPNVVVQRNTNTILSGTIFAESPGFSITLDQAWGSIINSDF